MSMQTMKICDGCDKPEQEKNVTGRHFYKLDLTTDRFWDGVETGENSIGLDFCDVCATHLKDRLTIIAGKNNG